MIATVALMRHGGSHLIRPIVANMGFKIIEPGNFGAPIDKAEGPVIVFVRDPRDRMVATHRWWMQKPGKRVQLRRAGSTADDQIAWLMGNSEGFLMAMRQWAHIWCLWPGALKVKFEDMRSDGVHEVERIAAHLGVTCDAETIFNEVYGKGRTYTGRHSDWREVFGPRCNKLWDRRGGPELLELMGYE